MLWHIRCFPPSLVFFTNDLRLEYSNERTSASWSSFNLCTFEYFNLHNCIKMYKLPVQTSNTVHNAYFTEFDGLQPAFIGYVCGYEQLLCQLRAAGKRGTQGQAHWRHHAPQRVCLCHSPVHRGQAFGG